MPILLLLSPDGFPTGVLTGKDLNRMFQDVAEEVTTDHLNRIIMGNVRKAIIVPPSDLDYVLTPSWWTRHKYEHVLRVNKDGTGIYFALARFPDSSIPFITEGKVRHVGPGDKTIKIPQDETKIALSGPARDLKTLVVYALVIYISEWDLRMLGRGKP